MTYKVTVTPEVRDFLDSLDDESARIVRKNLKKRTHPHPGEGIGDKERLIVQGEQMHRLHIGRTWTAFYVILEEEKEVRVIEVLPIDEAHERYGY